MFISDKKIADMLGSNLGYYGTKEKLLQGQIGSGDKDVSPADVFSFQLPDYKDGDIKLLLASLEKNEAPEKTISTVKRWVEVMKDPSNGEVTSLQSLEKVFGALIKKIPTGWLFFERADGEFCPVLVVDWKYKARNRDDSEYFEIKIVNGYYLSKSKDDREKTFTEESTFTFYRNSFDGDDSDNFFSAYLDAQAVGSEESEGEDNEDDEDKPKKKAKAKPKKEGVKLSEILANKKLYIPTRELFDKYEAQTAKFMKTYLKIGMQYTVNGLAVELSKDEEDSWRNSDRISLRQRVVSTIEDENKNKFVINSSGEINELKRSHASEKLGAKPIPYHPYVQMYDITKYRSVAIHVDKLEEYVYSTDIIDSLILPDEEKKLLSALIGGENNFQDIISGKSGGIIVLASGIAGTGKTLTAEVYAEVVKKPLYQIQSSQLGLNPQEIEKSLQAILRRADKWGAVLLIDECDAYVSKRGEDMVQNAVVGVFLRLLEYYRGILFLTTNRHDIIDDAIVSRLTAHIRYAVPERPFQLRILNLLAKKFEVEITDKEADAILDKYPQVTGRDIRNLLKLVKKYYHKENKQVKLTADMLNPIQKFIPFIKH